MSDQGSLFQPVTSRAVGLPIEAKLREWGLSYEYVEAFPVADIRSETWTQVRMGEHVFDKNTVKEFATQLRHGAVFPPVVLMEPSVQVDGNHRIGAFRAERRKVIPAFVVKFNSVEMARAFSAAVNNLNGRRLTPDEASKVALTMLRQRMSPESVAREIGYSKTFVESTRRRDEFGRRVEGNPELVRLMREKPVGAKAQEKLAQVKHDPVFAEAVKLVAEVRASPQVVTEIVEAAASAKSDAEAVAAVRAKRAELAPQGPSPQKVILPQAVRMCRAQVGGLLKFSANPPALLDMATEEAQKKAAGQWAELRDLAAEMLRLYGAEA